MVASVQILAVRSPISSMVLKGYCPANCLISGTAAGAAFEMSFTKRTKKIYSSSYTDISLDPLSIAG